MIREACVDTIADAMAAERAGADQLEWCGDLTSDGLTPDYETTVQLLEMVRIPVKVMIRSRSGDFVYTPAEMAVMKNDCKRFASLSGVTGLVFGATTNEKSVDVEKVKEMVQCCDGKPLTLHKAIDSCRDILSEVRKIQNLPGVGYILTSGGKSTAWEGREMIRDMQKIFTGKIIAAGKINAENLATLHSVLSLEYYHGRRIVG